MLATDDTQPFNVLEVAPEPSPMKEHAFAAAPAEIAAEEAPTPVLEDAAVPAEAPANEECFTVSEDEEVDGLKWHFYLLGLLKILWMYLGTFLQKHINHYRTYMVCFPLPS